MCGIVGIHQRDFRCSLDTGIVGMEVLQGLQHRGKESAGASLVIEDGIVTYKGLGLVQEAIPWREIALNPCKTFIGQVRYSTMGKGVERHERRTLGIQTPETSIKTKNSQPFYMPKEKAELSLVHNGNLTNAKELREWLDNHNVRLFSETDSELILQLIYFFYITEKYSLRHAIVRTMERMEGAFSCILATNGGSLFAFRDRFGFRPLKVAKTSSHWVLSSESCAWHKFGAAYEGSVAEGELWEISGDEVWKGVMLPHHQRAHCIFENIYLKSPCTNLTSEHNRSGGNATVGEFRKKLGKELASQHLPGIGPGVVVPMMESGEYFAYGVQFVHSMMYPGFSFIHNPLPKDKSIGRAFIEPTPEDRAQTIRLKCFNLFDSMRDTMEYILEHKPELWLICVDDSLVRSDTSLATISRIRSIVEEMFPQQYQRVKIAWLLGSPEIKHPCYMGIDFASQDELVAANLDEEEIRVRIGADYLGYLSLPDLQKVVGPECKQFCYACMNGQYPLEVDHSSHKMMLVSQ